MTTLNPIEDEVMDHRFRLAKIKKFERGAPDKPTCKSCFPRFLRCNRAHNSMSDAGAILTVQSKA
jgi:hypothetical protein